MSIIRDVKLIKKGENLLVTPKIVEFLGIHPEGVVWDDEAFEAFKKLTSKTFGSNSGRDGRFGASSRGMCMRRQIFAFHGAPSTVTNDVQLTNLFNDGKWRHMRWQMMGLQSGALEAVEVAYRMPKYRVSGSMDGMGNDPQDFGFELKGDRFFGRILKGLPEKHDLQVHTMMLATDIDLFSYVFESKDSQEWREVVVHRDEAIIQKVEEELQELNNYVDQNYLPDILPECQAKEGAYKSCPFAGRCLRQGGPPHGGEWTD